MANVLFTWELGGGFGHVVPYLPLIDELRSGGHKVGFAVRDVTRVAGMLEQHGVTLLQAPMMGRSAREPVKVTATYADVLHNEGFDDPGQVTALLRVWRNLFDLVKPDVVVFDHAPAALLAARGREFRKVVGGTGFTVPPSQYPLPVFRDHPSVDRVLAKEREDRVTAVINKALGSLGAAPLERLAQLFDPRETMLRTVAEFDHYAVRGKEAYGGLAPGVGGAKPAWPEGKGPKVFAYLKRAPVLPSILKALSAARVPTIAYVAGLEPQAAEEFRSRTLAFSSAPLDIAASAAQCDFAVLNGTHDTSVRLALAGKPALHVPLVVEQLITARRAQDLGVGLAVLPDQPAKLAGALRKLVSDGALSASAKSFALKYRGPRQGDYVERARKLMAL